MDEPKDDYFEKIELTEDESQIFNKLKECSRILSDYDDFQQDREKHFSLWKTGGVLSYDLYKRLTERGIDVKFNKYCLWNRTYAIPDGPANPEFHEHIDVIQGMVSFIEFKHAHDEIGDVTLGIECQFDIYCKRRSSFDCIYKTPAFIKRTSNGWWVRYFEINKETDKKCSAILKHIESQAICLPNDIGLAFDSLWEQAAEGQEIGDFKNKLKELSNWIEATEHNRPDWF
jgi:hypothetical protein